MKRLWENNSAFELGTVSIRISLNMEKDKKEKKCCQLERRRHDSSGKESLSLAFERVSLWSAAERFKSPEKDYFHRLLPLFSFTFFFYPQLYACATNMYHSAFNSCLKAAQIICQADTHASPPLLAHLRFLFCAESPAGRFSPLWPGFQVDRMTNGVWSPFLIRCNRTPLCFLAPPGEMHARKRGAFVALRRYRRGGPDSLQMQ